MSVSKIKPSLKSIVRTEFQKGKTNDNPGSWEQTCFQRCTKYQNLQKSKTVLVSFKSKAQPNQLYLQVSQSKINCVVTEPRTSQNKPFLAGVLEVFGLYLEIFRKILLIIDFMKK